MKPLICSGLHSSRSQSTTAVIILGRRFLPGAAAPVIAKGLSLLRIVAPSSIVTAQLSTDHAVVDAKLSGDLSLAHADIPLGVNLVSLGLGQLLVSHALLHFGRIWSPPRLQA